MREEEESSSSVLTASTTDNEDSDRWMPAPLRPRHSRIGLQFQATLPESAPRVHPRDPPIEVISSKRVKVLDD